MADEGETQSVGPSDQPHPIARSDSSTSTRPSDHNEPIIHQPIPQRPPLRTRKSSGPLVIPRDSSTVGPIEHNIGPDDVRVMSPRRTSEELDKMGKEAREEMRRYADALQDSLLTIFNRIKAVREEHDKLDNNNKFLQKYISDLTSTSKITASASQRKNADLRRLILHGTMDVSAINPTKPALSSASSQAAIWPPSWDGSCSRRLQNRPP